MKNNVFSGALVAIAGWFALLSGGCTSNPSIVDWQAVKRIHREFVHAFQLELPEPAVPRAINLVIDKTGSMRGFCNAGPTYRSFLEALENVFQPLPIQYSFLGPIVTTETLPALLSCSSYSALVANYEAFIHYIEGVSGDQPVLYVTDLQFNSTPDMRAFEKFLFGLTRKDGFFVELLAARLQFRGRYYPRGAPPWIHENAKHNGLRPIYCLVVSREQYRSTLQKAVAAAAQGVWGDSVVYHYRRSPIGISSILPGRRYTFYPSPIDKHRSAYVLYGLKRPRVRFTFTVDFTQLSGWKRLTKDNLSADVYLVSLKKDTVQFFATTRTTIQVHEATATKGKATFVASIDGLSKGTYYLVLLRYYLSGRNLPDWVFHLDCQPEDGYESQRQRTLHLRGILSYPLESVVTPFQYGYSLLIIAG